MFYSPTIISFLKAVPPQILSHEVAGLKHPGAMYNNMAHELLDTIKQLSKSLAEEDEDLIKSNLRLMLSQFYQFYDSCYEIMIPFCGQHAAKKPHEHWHVWLKKNGYTLGQSFHEKTFQSVSKLKVYYNALKHSSARLELLRFYNGYDTNYAYFLNPSPELPLAPISLGFQIRQIQHLIYFISERLQAVLTEHVKALHGVDITFELIKDKGSSFQTLFTETKALSRFYLLSEIGQNCPEAIDVNEGIAFTLSYVAECLYDDYYKGGITFSLVFRADGYHNTVTVPSFGMQPYGDPMHPILYFQRANSEKCWIPIISDKQVSRLDRPVKSTDGSGL